MKNTRNTGNGNARRSSRALGQRSLEIDETRLWQYAMAGLTVEELAATLNVPTEQLERDYGERIRREAARGIGMLRRKAFEMAILMKNEKMLCFLMNRYDPQLRELRDLEVRERRLKLERMENEEKQRAQLAVELQKVQLQREQLALSAQQQEAARQKEQEESARLDDMSREELDVRYSKAALQAELLEMDDPSQRDEALQAVAPLVAQLMRADPKALEMARWITTIPAQDLNRILRSHGIDPATVLPV